MIASGYACPSNLFFAQELAATGYAFLAITSANRFRRLTGTTEEPAHWKAAHLRAEFAAEGAKMILEHDDEAAARAAFPRHRLMSTTVLDLHTAPPGPDLVVRRQGSLPMDSVRETAAQACLDVVPRPRASAATERRCVR
ncbi:hypothetical protein [Streptomyces sp. NPDC101249]|uniref:hypothetical protein n=1 Tax=Streptomyces sp. NPDC101249 TaxID=3366140 RepID=UPI0037F20E88